MDSNLIDLKATLAMRVEDLRIATKHREEAAARIMSPANRRSYEGALAWETHCREREQIARGSVIGASLGAVA